MSQNTQINTLYKQLKKDLRKVQRKERVYIPVVVFQKPEELKVEGKKGKVNRLASAVTSIIK